MAGERWRGEGERGGGGEVEGERRREERWRGIEGVGEMWREMWRGRGRGERGGRRERWRGGS